MISNKYAFKDEVVVGEDNYQCAWHSQLFISDCFFSHL